MTTENSEHEDGPIVLLIDDEFKESQELSSFLTRHGYTVRVVDTLPQIPDAIRLQLPDVMIVNSVICGIDVLPLISHWREQSSQAPVLFVSRLSSVENRIRLKAKGDDYLIKPFSLKELKFRIEVLLRQSFHDRASILRIGPLTMDLIERVARRGDRHLDLRLREFELLEYFMRNAHQVITREILLTDVWGFRAFRQTNIVDVYISKLRRKVDGPGEAPLLKTIRGAGFTLEFDRRTRSCDLIAQR